MNKHAAEKIASEYYNLGLQLALENAGLTKVAMGALGKGALGLGGLGGGHMLARNATEILGPKSQLAKLIEQKAAGGEEALMKLLGMGG